MSDLDEKVAQYTLEFSRSCELEIDEATLRDNIGRHLQSARAVVTEATLLSIGHVHLSVMINTAARYDQTLGEVMLEGVRKGVQPITPLCTAIQARKNSVSRIQQQPRLRIVK